MGKSRLGNVNSSVDSVNTLTASLRQESLRPILVNVGISRVLMELGTQLLRVRKVMSAEVEVPKRGTSSSKRFDRFASASIPQSLVGSVH